MNVGQAPDDGLSKTAKKALRASPGHYGNPWCEFCQWTGLAVEGSLV